MLTFASCVAGPGSARQKRRGSEAVVVVGAGIAGLAAARELMNAGLDVVVLEGRDRIGGRIWTDRSLGAPVEMGAGAITQGDGNPLSALAVEGKFPMEALDSEDIQLVDAKGVPLSRETQTAILEEYYFLLEDLDRFAREAERGLSTMEVLSKVLDRGSLSPQAAALLPWWFARQIANAGAEISEISTHGDSQQDGFAGADRFLVGGMDQLCTHLAAGLDIKLKAEVRRIRSKRSYVRVEADRGTFDADYAIVTLPAAVLQKQTVEFYPDLSVAKKEAAQHLSVGNLNRIAIQFEEAFWPVEHRALGFAGRNRKDFQLLSRVNSDPKTSVLSVTVAGSRALDLDIESDVDLAKRVKGTIDALFGQVARPASKILAARWGADRFALGAFPRLGLGGNGAAFDELARSEGRISFAGDGTNRQYPGTAHGAYLSGLRAARKLIALKTGRTA